MITERGAFINQCSCNVQVSDYRKKRVHHGRQGGADQVEAEDSRRGQVGQEQAEVGEREL